LYEQLNELSLRSRHRLAPVASSLASKLNVWVKADNSFTTDGKIVYVWLTTKDLVFHEITVGATCTKRAAYKEQATEFFEEASALNTDAGISDLKKRIQ
jgi:hypothetical protein